MKYLFFLFLFCPAILIGQNYSDILTQDSNTVYLYEDCSGKPERVIYLTLVKSNIDTILSIPFSSITTNRKYKVTKAKAAGWAGSAVSGFVDGVVEGYGFDGRTSFQRKYNVSETGFFGARSWECAYKNPNLYTRYFGVPDFYHTADDLRKIGYIGSGITIGISGSRANKKYWHYALDFAVGLAVSGAAKSAGMYWVRH